jgi:HK97 family phage portal protein
VKPILDLLTNKAPVPMSGSGSGNGYGRLFGWTNPSKGRSAQLDSLTASATLFGIVDLTSTSTAAQGWHLHRKVLDPTVVCDHEGCDVQGVQNVVKHPALTLLNTPNPFYTRQEYVATGQQHLDLTGESWTVISRIGEVPAELWNLRPDRITVVESAAEFLLGYVYTDEDGKEWGIRKEDMLSIRKPHPKDPYRGLSPVQSILDNAYASKAGTQYQGTFLANGARPGGIVKLKRHMEDEEFEDFVDRFNFNHRGAGNAGKTAFMDSDEAEWIDVKPYTMADMQFVEGANLNRDTIMLAYRMSKFVLGITETGVTRTVAEASDVWFGSKQTMPRLDMWQQMLNNDFLPQFPNYQYDLEFVYDNPVPQDREAIRADKQAAVDMYIKLTSAGVDPIDAAMYVGLPPMKMTQIEAREEVTA